VADKSVMAIVYIHPCPDGYYTVTATGPFETEEEAIAVAEEWTSECVEEGTISDALH
jgi:hypothetical protein